MTGRGGRRSRRLSDGEKALWAKVAESVTPLVVRTAPEPEDQASSQKPAPKPDPTPAKTTPAPPAKRQKTPKAPAPQPVSKRPLSPPPGPPLAPLEAKLRRRLSRGVVAIDARVDLHGLRQDEAQARLVSFLAMAQASGFKVVLVITGKGRPSDAGGDWFGPERGVLRRAVPLWLASPAARRLVVGFEPADVIHGGAGALYVRIRKAGAGR